MIIDQQFLKHFYHQKINHFTIINPNHVNKQSLQESTWKSSIIETPKLVKILNLHMQNKIAHDLYSSDTYIAVITCNYHSFLSPLNIWHTRLYTMIHINEYFQLQL